MCAIYGTACVSKVMGDMLHMVQTGRQQTTDMPRLGHWRISHKSRILCMRTMSVLMLLSCVSGTEYVLVLFVQSEWVLGYHWVCCQCVPCPLTDTHTWGALVVSIVGTYAVVQYWRWCIYLMNCGGWGDMVSPFCTCRKTSMHACNVETPIHPD